MVFTVKLGGARRKIGSAGRKTLDANRSKEVHRWNLMFQKKLLLKEFSNTCHFLIKKIEVIKVPMYKGQVLLGARWLTTPSQI